MARPAPCELVRTLDPRPESVLKREEHTVVWRETTGAGEPVIVKLYRMRGRAKSLRCRLTRFRTEREYRRLRHLVRWDIPCTVPVAWAAGWSEDHGHHEILLTREVPRAIQLGRYLREREVAPRDLAPLFRIVRRMHDSGFCHQALYLYNVLVDPDAPPESRFFISDVPRSWTFPRSITGTGMALYDLLDLTIELGQAGIRRDSIPLDTYGLDRSEKRFLALEAKADPRTKRRRLVRDVTARLRWTEEWATSWKRPPPRESLRAFRVQGSNPATR
jgi:tRNA A-37 threonylcarbamoyl transferase component Bud32